MKPEIVRGGLILGIIEIILGICYLVCTIVFNARIGSPSALTFVGCIPLIVVGILGLIFGLKKNRGLLIAHMVVSILVCIILVIGAIILGIAIGAVDTCNAIHQGRCDDNAEVEIALLRSFVAFAALGVFATLASSVLGCVGACCNKGE